MPSYMDDTLASYYEEDFPIYVPVWEMIPTWRIVREIYRKFSAQKTINRMRVMEWAVKGLFGLDDNAALRKAAQIAEEERILPKAQQNFGNLLAVLKSKVGTGIKDHEQIEEMFKFILGKLPPKNTTLFHTLLNITVDYARNYKIVLPAAVFEYDDQHREFPASSILHLQPATVLEPQALRFTPLADQQKLPSTEGNIEAQIQTILSLSLQDDEHEMKSIVQISETSLKLNQG